MPRGKVAVRQVQDSTLRPAMEAVSHGTRRLDVATLQTGGEPMEWVVQGGMCEFAGMEEGRKMER